MGDIRAVNGQVHRSTFFKDLEAYGGWLTSEFSVCFTGL